MTTNTKIAIAIYTATLGILLYYNLTHPPVNDGVKEYEAFLLNLRDGWEYRRTLVNSSLVTTWLPAMLQRAFGGDPMVWFRVFPPLFYALMPSFTYLIARRVLAARYAVITALVVITNSHILFFPDIGRVGVGIALMAGLIWALLERRPVIATLLSLLIVFSHYGTTLICAGLVVAVLIGRAILRQPLIKSYVLVACILVVSGGLWHFWISDYSGWVMFTYGIQTDMPNLTGDVVGPEYDITDSSVWLDIRSRETAVQRAVNISSNTTIPALIETLVNWVVVGLITVGLYVLIRRRDSVDVTHRLIGLLLWLLILFTVAVPWLSVFYGGMRVYFTALSVLATCFPLGVQAVAKWTRVPVLVTCLVVLVAFALVTSGAVYTMFGEAKTLPVYWSVGDLNLQDLGVLP